jgi:hypothetical protein
LPKQSISSLLSGGIFGILLMFSSNFYLRALQVASQSGSYGSTSSPFSSSSSLGASKSSSSLLATFSGP